MVNNYFCNRYKNKKQGGISMYKISNKIIASMLLLILTISQLSLIGIYGKEVYAADSSLESQGVATNNANVEFDVYFIVGENETHTAYKNIREENSIYAKVNVKNSGYLKNTQIQFSSENEGKPNFKILEGKENSIIQSINEQSNTVVLNKIDNGKEQVIEIPIELNYSEEILLSELSRESKAIFTGIYVDKDGKENEIEKEITVKLSWEEEKENVELVLEEEISKFIPYTINGEEGIILQTTIKSAVENNLLPVKTTTIQAKVPTINGIKPSNVKVYANTTKATNGGETGYNFSEENYTYNSEESILTITVENKVDENGKIAWKKEAIDEYKVTYFFSKEAKDSITQEGVKIALETSSTLNLYDSRQIVEKAKITQTRTLKDQIGKITEVSIENITQNLSKGYIYANYLAQDKIETTYNQVLAVEVIAPQLVDKIELEQNEEYFKTNEEKYVSTDSKSNYTYYKKISVNKDIVNKILGEEATIKIYNGENLVETINKEVIEKAEQNIEIDLSTKDINSIKIQTSKPVAEGKLEFNIEKAIKGEIGYTKSQMQRVEALNTSFKETTIVEEKAIEETNVTNEIKFVEPETKADIVISKENLSTVVKNENVELKAILRTDSVNNNLYKNPTITIQLPKYIENIEIKDVNMLFDKELTITSTNIVTNSDGSKAIVVKTSGEQTKYSIGSVTGGANIVITASLTVNRLTSNRTETILMSYSNENTNDDVFSETKTAQTNVTFVAPVGVITTASIENYAEGKEQLTSMSGEEATAQIQIMSEARDVKFNMSVINNYNNTIDSVKVLGRIPSKGSKDLVTGEDLSSTFDMKLKSDIEVAGIDSSRITIYYSTNVNATTDLSNTSNAWTTTVENYETIKSYLIVVTGTINTAEAIDFSYTAELPESLQYNETSVENYIVYFNNNLETGKIEDKQLATPITITTGLGPVIEAELYSNISADQKVLEGRTIKYTINVKNTGTEPAQNVKIEIPIPEYLRYIEYVDIQKDLYDENYELKTLTYTEEVLDVNETLTKEFYFIVRNVDSEEETVKVKASITFGENTNTIETNEVTNKIGKAKFYISSYQVYNEKYYIEEADEFKYAFQVYTRDYNETAENTVLTTVLPEGVTYKSVKIEDVDIINYNGEIKEIQVKTTYNEKTRELTVNLGTVEYSLAKRITITTTVDSLPENQYSRTLKILATVTSGNISETSTAKEFEVLKEAVEVTQTANIPSGSKISAGENLVYTATIKNIGSKDVTVTVSDEIPSAVEFGILQYDLNGTTMYRNDIKNGTIGATLTIPVGETRQVKVTVTPKIVTQDTTITNVIKVKKANIEETSNAITHTIETTKYTIPDDDNNGEQDPTTVNKISGVVWKDENKNGIKDSDEQVMSGVEVMLYNATKNTIFAKDGKAIILTTNENGIYTFENVPAGKYMVIFLYETGKYNATTYNAEGSNSDNNSDAIDTKITLDGEQITAAVTNTITLEGSNIYNINLGLVDNPKFDLKLNKTISKITIQDPTGVKEYTYNDEKLTKVEFVEKYLGQTTVVVEYKITVTNEGAIEGFVKKIADYLPTEMSFSSELNRDWYIAENGTIYNSSLSNTKILPGESKEITLILTKTVNANNLGTVSNTAEIYEAYNDEGIEDYDSTPGNKASNEDDLSTADVVLSIKTGKVATFIGLTLSIIVIIGISAYFIKKKVLR